MLVAALLLSALMLVMGMALLAVRSREYDQALFERQAAQARFLAELGMQDALQKLARDIGFPPTLGERTDFSYAEEVYDPATGAFVGSYSVSLDLSHAGDAASPGSYRYPNYTVIIRSTGCLYGPATPEEAAQGATRSMVASRTLKAELDLCPKKRGASPDGSSPSDRYDDRDYSYYTNPNYGGLVRWQDSAGF
jgi:hypothetical protein